MFPGLVAPQIHDPLGHGIGLVIISPVFRGFISGHGLKHLMSAPIVFQSPDELGHGAFFSVKNKIFYGQQGIDGCRIGDRFKRGQINFRTPAGDIQTLFGTAPDQTGKIGGGEIFRSERFRRLINLNAFPDNIFSLPGIGIPEIVPGFKIGRFSRIRSVLMDRFFLCRSWGSKTDSYPFRR